jgi:hypothetical protein
MVFEYSKTTDGYAANTTTDYCGKWQRLKRWRIVYPLDYLCRLQWVLCKVRQNVSSKPHLFGHVPEKHPLLKVYSLVHHYGWGIYRKPGREGIWTKVWQSKLKNDLLRRKKNEEEINRPNNYGYINLSMAGSGHSRPICRQETALRALKI